jgi:hypothetical protein
VNTDYLFTIINLIILGSTAYIAFVRSKSQGVVDDSQASKNFRDIILSLQMEVKEVRKENVQIKGLLERSHCNIMLGIEIGKKPEILDYEWTASKENAEG